MTTIKEYKTMMEGATPAPWKVDEYMAGVEKNYKSCAIMCPEDNQVICEIPDYCFHEKEVLNNKSNAQFIAASRNIAPELIRVIYLAEDALEACEPMFDALTFAQAKKAKETLSEIKKLKGE